MGGLFRLLVATVGLSASRQRNLRCVAGPKRWKRKSGDISGHPSDPISPILFQAEWVVDLVLSPQERTPSLGVLRGPRGTDWTLLDLLVEVGVQANEEEGGSFSFGPLEWPRSERPVQLFAGV